MKQLVAILILFPLFLSCSDDDDSVNDTYVQIKSKITIENVIIAYINDKGNFSTIKELGQLNKNSNSENIRLRAELPIELYVFGEIDGNYIRFSEMFRIKHEKNNEINIDIESKYIKIDDINNPKEYPRRYYIEY